MITLEYIQTELRKLEDENKVITKDSPKFKLNELKIERLKELVEGLDKIVQAPELVDMPSYISDSTTAQLIMSGQDVSLDMMVKGVEKKLIKNQKKLRLENSKLYQRYLRKKQIKKIKFLEKILDDLKQEYIKKNEQMKDAERRGDNETALKIFSKDFTILEQRKDVIVYEILSRQQKLYGAG